MNNLGTITQRFDTPVMDSMARSQAARQTTPERLERMREYHRKHYRGAFEPDARWKRCAGAGREEQE